MGLDAVRGIEIEAYAAELARVTLWIGDLQWMRKNGYSAYAEPILSKLEQIENRDALLNPDGYRGGVAGGGCDHREFRRSWATSKMIADIGEDYVATLRETYRGRVPGGADFVTYWVERLGERSREGLTDEPGWSPPTRSGAARACKVLDPIADADALWEAWADEPWVSRRCGGARLDARFRGRISSSGGGWTSGTTSRLCHQTMTDDGTSAGTAMQPLRPVKKLWTIHVVVSFQTAQKLVRPNSDVHQNVGRSMADSRAHDPREKWIIDFAGLVGAASGFRGSLSNIDCPDVEAGAATAIR